MNKEYKIFVSHSWEGTSMYEELIALLSNKDNFNFENLSIRPEKAIELSPKQTILSLAVSMKYPSNNGLSLEEFLDGEINRANREALVDILEDPIGEADVILIVMLPDNAIAQFVREELERSQMLKKTIIAIKPPCIHEESIQYIYEMSDIIVEWDSEIIIQTIKDCS